MTIENFFQEIQQWAKNEDNIRAAGLAGSYARGNTKPDSDIDLVILCDDYQVFLENQSWVSQFGDFKEKALKIGSGLSLSAFIMILAKLNLALGRYLGLA